MVYEEKKKSEVVTRLNEPEPQKKSVIKLGKLVKSSKGADFGHKLNFLIYKLEELAVYPMKVANEELKM